VLGFPLLALVLKLIEWAGSKLVDLGSGGRDRVPIAFANDCPCGDHAALQQIHAAAGGFLPCANASLHWRSAPIFQPQHRSNGRQQTVRITPTPSSPDSDVFAKLSFSTH